MKLIKFCSLLVLLSIIFLLPASAFAHPGFAHGPGFFNAFIHPFSGLDHILAMVAVGILAFKSGGRALWVLPAAFLSLMLLGCILGLTGLTVPFIEGGVITSVLILGLLIAVAASLPLAPAMSIVGLFALFHGFAHGTEMPLAASGLVYVAGFTAATLLLHLGGIVTGLLLQKTAGARLIRYSGAAIAASGVYMFIA
ncbi:MAG: HupE/UreJ family protein [Thermodesulfobacteriota bacterium]